MHECQFVCYLVSQRSSTIVHHGLTASGMTSYNRTFVIFHKRYKNKSNAFWNREYETSVFHLIHSRVDILWNIKQADLKFTN